MALEWQNPGASSRRRASPGSREQGARKRRSGRGENGARIRCLLPPGLPYTPHLSAATLGLSITHIFAAFARSEGYHSRNTPGFPVTRDRICHLRCGTPGSSRDMGNSQTLGPSRTVPQPPPPRNRYQALRRRPLIWILGVGAAGLVLTLAALFLRTLSHSAQLTLEPHQIETAGGNAFQVELKRLLPWAWQPLGDHSFNLYRSDLLLHEDGEPMGRPHTAFAAVRDEGGGGYLQWGRLLIFSTPDGTDPRTNGRTYHIEFTTGINGRILRRFADMGGLLLLAAAVGILWVGRRPILAALRARAHHVVERRSDYALAAFTPALLSLAIWWLVPPLWNGSDSVIWLLWQLTWIPHHPPIYPGFMALLKGLDNDPAVMLNAARTIQHVLYVFSVTYLASASRRPWPILLLSVTTSLGAGLGLFANGLFTEGLAVPMLVLFLGAVLRLCRDGLTRGVASMLAVTLLLASLTRHVLIVLAVVPLGFLLFQALLQRLLGVHWRTLGSVMLLMLGVGVANAGINGYVSLLLDAQQVSILGRAGVYRIQAAYKLVPTAKRPAWLAALQARAKEPSEREALALMAKTPNPWTGPRDAIAETPTLFGRHPDALMNAGFKTFAFALEPYALQQWAQELVRAAVGPGVADFCPGQVSCLLRGSIDSIESVFPLDPRSLEAVAGTGAGAPDAAAPYRRLAGQPWVVLFDALLALAPLPRSIFLGVSLGFLVMAVALSRDRRAQSLMLSLWVGALVYALTLTFVTVVLPRYLVPIDLLLWITNALALMALIEPDGGDWGRQQPARTADRD